ncbi:unnamed protein product [Sphenostylis stenocarpa]|uniref:TF-B3 domain-containing protein n=1 Tax=Sphenostylis stenocarpa TaxID=92480 RepID=A0AA86VGQ8_9FABA|nr:unnamed protein product [Sphenostylis stenocarpa]
MADSSSSSAQPMIEGSKRTNEILLNDEWQLEFILNAGIVKDCELSLPYRAQLTNDKWNLFLSLEGFEETLTGFLKEEEDVTEGIEVNVYDRGGHEFQMMLKKCVQHSNRFYVLNRGWFSFRNQHGLGQDDLIALRVFRHAITDILSFVLTYQRIR